MNWGKNITRFMSIVILWVLVADAIAYAARPNVNDNRCDTQSRAYQQGLADEAKHKPHKLFARSRTRDAYNCARLTMRKRMASGKKYNFEEKTPRPYENPYRTQKSYSELYDHGPMYGNTGIEALR